MRSNRVVIVTGAGGGIGNLIVRRFLENDDTVVACDNQPDRLEELRHVSFSPGRLLTSVGDVSDEASCAAVADFARSSVGHIDVLVNCAGWFPVTPFEDVSPLLFRRVIDVNLVGTFLISHAILPLMKGRGWGRIINFGSASVFHGVANQLHYVAAKAGVVGLTRSMARALGADGITVNVVAPGLTVTPAVRLAMPAEKLQRQIEERSIPRDQAPEDLVGTVFFLASPDADFPTGQTLTVDGGKAMR